MEGLIEFDEVPPVYVKVMGKLYRVLAIGADEAQANAYCERVDHGAVIWAEKNRVYIVDKRDKGERLAL